MFDLGRSFRAAAERRPNTPAALRLIQRERTSKQ